MPVAIRRSTGRGHVKSYGTGRACAEPDCETILSRYNELGVCSVHDPDDKLRDY